MINKNKYYKNSSKKLCNVEKLCYFLTKNYCILTSSNFNETVSIIINYSIEEKKVIKKMEYLPSFFDNKNISFNDKNIFFPVAKLGFDRFMIIKNIRKVYEYIKILKKEKKIFVEKIFLSSTNSIRLELDLNIVTI